MIDVKECRRTLETRLESRRVANRGLWRLARNDATRLVEHIAKTYHPEKVIQWGSVLDADRFDSLSDIDIAVEGDFDAETWFELLGDMLTMTKFPVDIVDLRHIEPEFADIIRMKGTVVYARNPSSC